MRYKPPLKMKRFIEFTPAPEGRLDALRDAGVQEPDEEPCWTWTGSLNSAGYGQLRYNARVWNTHKLVFHILARKHPELSAPEVPGKARSGSGLIWDHICENRKCCNPAHLEEISQSENVHRGARHRSSTSKEETQ